jgi:hypothetical protein
MLMGQHKLKFYTISWKASWPPQAHKLVKVKEKSIQGVQPDDQSANMSQSFRIMESQI